MQIAHRRRLVIAIASSGVVLVMLAVIGVYGLFRGESQVGQSDPTALTTSVPFQSVEVAGFPRPVPSTKDGEMFARSVARALFTWDTRAEAGVSEWEQELVDVAHPAEAAAVASDVRNYLPTTEMWEQLGTFGTRQWIRLESVSVPRSWSTALRQAAPGQIPPDALAFTVTGTSHREGIWGTEPLNTERQVSFTIFVVCPSETPCSLLRLSQLNRPLN